MQASHDFLGAAKLQSAQGGRRYNPHYAAVESAMSPLGPKAYMCIDYCFKNFACLVCYD